MIESTAAIKLLDWLKQNIGAVLLTIVIAFIALLTKCSYDKGLDGFNDRCKTQVGPHEYLGNKCPGKVPDTIKQIIVQPTNASLKHDDKNPPQRRIEAAPNKAPEIQNNGGVKNQNNGIMNGTNNHIGDDVYNGIKQREASKAFIDSLTALFPYRDRVIDIQIPLQDSEAENFAKDIWLSLSLKGYKMVVWNYAMGAIIPNFPNNVCARINPENGRLILIVLAARNV